MPAAIYFPPDAAPMLECCVKCWCFIDDELVMAGFVWRRCSALSAIFAAIVFVRSVFSDTSVLRTAILVAAVFICSMVALAAITVYRFHKSCRHKTVADPSEGAETTRSYRPE